MRINKLIILGLLNFFISNAFADKPCEPSQISVVKNIVANFSGQICGDINRDAKFSQLHMGMSAKEVQNLIGSPNDQNIYQTVKSYLPASADASRMVFYYKNHGRLVFSNTGEHLTRIEIDSTEDGYY